MPTGTAANHKFSQAEGQELLIPEKEGPPSPKRARPLFMKDGSQQSLNRVGYLSKLMTICLLIAYWMKMTPLHFRKRTKKDILLCLMDH